MAESCSDWALLEEKLAQAEGAPAEALTGAAFQANSESCKRGKTATKVEALLAWQNGEKAGGSHFHCLDSVSRRAPLCMKPLERAIWTWHLGEVKLCQLLFQFFRSLGSLFLHPRSGSCCYAEHPRTLWTRLGVQPTRHVLCRAHKVLSRLAARWQ